MTLDRLETIARAAELDWDAVLATGQVTTDSNADYIAALSPAMTLALIERLREAEQLVQRLWVLARHTDLAMDLWWQASDDNWAVPDSLPSRFLEFSLAKCGVEWEPAEARALPDGDACICTEHSEDRGSGYYEWMLEYEPMCPQHSEHLYDPRSREFVSREAKERLAAVDALHRREHITAPEADCAVGECFHKGDHSTVNLTVCAGCRSVVEQVYVYVLEGDDASGAIDWPCPTHLAVHPECADGCEHTP